jgi:SAM-dependent methyltransferase
MSSEISIPVEDDPETLRDYLSHSLVTPTARDELVAYASIHLPRLMVTLDLVPRREGRLLEIGARPYFFTLLLRKFRQYQLTLTNCAEDVEYTGVESLVNSRYRETHRFDYSHVNLDHDPLPFGDQQFEVVVFCEVLEHLALDPVHALLEIQRVMTPGGHLILSTPNAARLDIVLRAVRGDSSVFPAYHHYGLYGRHNREYTPAEVRLLLEATGFQVERCFTADLRGSSAGGELRQRGIRACGERGEFCYVVARPWGTVGARYPAFLYE